MLDILEFTKWLGKELSLTAYPLIFPVGSANECCVVNLTDILGRKADVKQLDCTVYCRSKRPDTGIETANKIIKRLDRETSLVFGDTQVLSILAVNSAGRFVGQDNNGLYIFTATFNITICDN